MKVQNRVSTQLEEAFQQRRYPKLPLDRSKTAVEPITQLDLLNNQIPDQNKNKDKIIYVTTYHPGAPPIKKSHHEVFKNTESASTYKPFRNFELLIYPDDDHVLNEA